VKSIFFRNEENSKISGMQRTVNLFIVLLCVGLVLVYSFIKIHYKVRLEVIYTYRYKFYMGFLMTIVLSTFSLILSMIIGTVFAFAGKSKFLPLYYLNRVYVEIIRGTPLLVQIFVFFYIVATAFNLSNRYILGVVILSVFAGAYISEIIRAGIESIDKTQIDTARSLGFTTYQRYRFIIVPQVMKRILPPLAGQFVSLVKDSSLLSVIAVSELTKNVQEIDSINFATFENYIVLALLYLIITMPISALSKKLERKFTYEA
jgi:amine acid ABC transporter, permease protein, 3-TM region, His/Glu/Gln/Arg/opine family